MMDTLINVVKKESTEKARMRMICKLDLVIIYDRIKNLITATSAIKFKSIHFCTNQ